MQIELIATGNEVLFGDIVDSNSSWISSRLLEEGFPVHRVHVVGDERVVLKNLFMERAGRADCVLVSGGLGPTEDDLTTEMAAEVAGVNLVQNEYWVGRLKERFKGRHLAESNFKQALLPQGAELLDNPEGTACGFALMIKGTLFCFSPGVPREMKTMFTEQVLPRLRSRFKPAGQKILKRIFTFGLSESRVGEQVKKVLPSHIDLGFRASFPLIEVKLSGEEERVRLAELEVKKELNDFVFCDDKGDPGFWIQEWMNQQKKTLAVAESCTGGLISDMIVKVAGSSSFFKGGVVAYADEVKSGILGVHGDSLSQFGAVSETVALEMARGVGEKLGADMALSVTGIAGPDGGTPEKPVGLVCFGLYSRSFQFVQTLRFPDWGRTRIRHASAMVTLDMLRRHLSGRPMLPDYDYAKRISYSN